MKGGSPPSLGSILLVREEVTLRGLPVTGTPQVLVIGRTLRTGPGAQRAVGMAWKQDNGGNPG